LALIAFLPKIKVELKERRGVAGLISVIAIVLVFGIAVTASLHLNSQQASLISSTSRTIDVQGKKATEQLQFKITSCVIKDSKYEITAKANSTWSESSILDSAIFVDDAENKVTDSVYIPSDYKTIPSMIVNDEVKVNATSAVTAADKVIFVTELGKKFATLSGFPLTCS